MSLLGLGGIGDNLKSVIESIQAPVNKAIAELGGLETKVIKERITGLDRGASRLEKATQPLVRAVSSRSVPTTETRRSFEEALVTATARERLARELVERLRAELNRRPSSWGMTDLKAKLEDAWKLYRAGNYRDPVLAELVEANHEPAKELFRAMLDHKNERFRTRALSHLQEMRDLSSDRDILEKVRDLVENDPEELTRTGAAMVLGAHSHWPDGALERALAKEEDAQTKQEIFLSILRLMTSWEFADEKRSAVDGGDIELSLKSAEKLARDYEKGG